MHLLSECCPSFPSCHLQLCDNLHDLPVYSSDGSLQGASSSHSNCPRWWELAQLTNLVNGPTATAGMSIDDIRSTAAPTSAARTSVGVSLFITRPFTLLCFFDNVVISSSRLLQYIHHIMASYKANLSNEGHTYSKKQGLVGGLHTYAVIKPEQKIRHAANYHVWDAIVIGSGYTGLIAARDFVKAGESGITLQKSRKSPAH